MEDNCEHNYEDKYYCCKLLCPCVEYGMDNIDRICPIAYDRDGCFHKRVEQICSECGKIKEKI